MLPNGSSSRVCGREAVTCDRHIVSSWIDPQPLKHTHAETHTAKTLLSVKYIHYSQLAILRFCKNSQPQIIQQPFSHFPNILILSDCVRCFKANSNLKLMSLTTDINILLFILQIRMWMSSYLFERSPTISFLCWEE